MMKNNIQYKENSIYSKEAIEAVRYGFQYRKEAEVHATENGCQLNHCLPAPSDILVFLAEAIIGGIAYDVLKSVVKKTWEKLKGSKLINKDKDVHDILTTEKSLDEFYTYIKEFHQREMNITEIQEKYIKEEVRADYHGEKSGIIYEEYNRLASVEELIIINKEAFQKANRIIVRKKES